MLGKLSIIGVVGAVLMIPMAVGPGFGAKRKAPVAGLEQVDPLRLVKSPASPTRQLTRCQRRWQVLALPSA